VRRSAVASTFGGALEMAKRGLIEIQQDKNYAPIYIRRPGEAGAAPKEAPPETPVDRDAVAAQEAELDALAAEEMIADQTREGAAAEAESMAADIDMPTAVEELSEALAGHLTADLTDITTDQEDLSDIERIQQEEA
jgi:hypothetical protein